MKRRMVLWLSVVAIILGLHPSAIASVPATGGFTAGKACQAYQSMRGRTNPGRVHVDAGRTYPIIEQNVPDRPTWYRLRIDGAVPTERWVYFDCGTVKGDEQEQSSSAEEGQHGKKPCNTAGLADSYVLAVSWQPAFCESHRDKPECKVTDPTSYQAGHFTLHGLWPNKKSCGTGYGFCGKYAGEVKPFCQYDAVPMQAATLQQLGTVMPSAAYGSCLQRHEWYKHGTCQTRWEADGYFTLAMRLLSEFNDSGMADFMQRNIGRTVSAQSFFDAFDKAFREGAHTRLQISCSGGKLVDVYISLPAEIHDDSPLADLIQGAPPQFSNKCGARFEVDAIDR